MLSLNYVGIVTASLGMLLFLPQIIKELGVTNMQVGWITMILTSPAGSAWCSATDCPTG
jgi:polyferredoxin